MAKKTKRAKRVKVKWFETKQYFSSYDCPSRCATYKGYVSGRNTTRFICKCGQELIIDRRQDERLPRYHISSAIVYITFMEKVIL